MPTFTTQRRVAHTPDQMYGLVADVERYPEFLPLCESLAVIARAPTGEGHERVVARMTAGMGPIRETFTSEVTLLPGERRILVRYVDGPFRRLENRWEFRPDPKTGGCVVDFFIDYEFRSLALQLVMGTLFDRAFRKFAGAFEARAEQVYGRPGGEARAGV